MLISELIAHLEGLKNQHGDCNIYMRDTRVHKKSLYCEVTEEDVFWDHECEIHEIPYDGIYILT